MQIFELQSNKGEEKEMTNGGKTKCAPLVLPFKWWTTECIPMTGSTMFPPFTLGLSNYA